MNVSNVVAGGLTLVVSQTGSNVVAGGLTRVLSWIGSDLLAVVSPLWSRGNGFIALVMLFYPYLISFVSILMMHKLCKIELAACHIKGLVACHTKRDLLFVIQKGTDCLSYKKGLTTCHTQK